MNDMFLIFGVDRQWAARHRRTYGFGYDEEKENPLLAWSFNCTADELAVALEDGELKFERQCWSDTELQEYLNGKAFT